MGVLTQTFTRSGLATPEKWVVDWFDGGAQTPAGVAVSEKTALHYSPFFAGVRLISEDVASLPFPVYRRLSRGKERDRAHRVSRLLNVEANPLMSGQTFRETLMGHALTWGIGAAEVVQDGQGRIVELWPLRPDRLTVETFGGGRQVQYRYQDVTGMTVFSPQQLLIVHGLGFDGIRGYSVLEHARRSIGLGVAAETYGSRFFGSDGSPTGVLTHPGVLSDSGKQHLRESWQRLHSGPDNAHRIAILEEGVTWERIGIPPNDSQFLETRRYQVVDMARWLRIPPHKLGELDRATWANIEHQQLEYVTETLRVWLTRWESAVNRRLFSDVERDREGLFAEHVIEGLLRGDMQARFQAYRLGREMGVYSANDVRELENRNPVPGGDLYVMPLNWAPITSEPARSGGRSVSSRRRVAESWRPTFEAVDLEAAQEERAAVLALVDRHFPGGSMSAFSADVQDLFEGRIPAEVERWMGPTGELAAAVAAEAAEEVGSDQIPDLTPWVAGYVAAHAAYRTGSAKRKVLSVAESAPEDAVADVVRRHLDAEVVARPARTARWETTQTANGATRETWLAAGVRRLRWVTAGEDCPYCTSMDGREVPIVEPFAQAGTELGIGEKLAVKHTVFTPPIHPGCDCTVVPA